MTQARMILPGDVVFATSRVVARFFLLRPDPEMCRAFGYLLAHYASKYDITLYAACLMSTHWHLVFEDRAGSRPAFLRDFNRGLANFVKAYRGWRGTVFQNHPSQVRLLTEDAIVDKIAYTMSNPVAAGAVRRSEDWPGLLSRVRDLGNAPRSYALPRRYFDQEGSMPRASTLGFSLPLRSGHPRESLRNDIQDAVRHHEQRARKEVELQGWSFIGPERAMRISPFKRAKAYEVFGDRNPTFATKGGGLSAFLAAVAELRIFRACYRDALTQWKAGLRDVVFPLGTWLMRVVHGVLCEVAAA